MAANEFIESLKSQGKLLHSVDPGYRPRLKVNGKAFGRDFVVIAGPCSVETKRQIVDYAKKLRDAGADLLRGGAYKPCTFPIKTKQAYGWREGLGERGLELLAEAREASGLKVITEVLDVRHLPLVCRHTDFLQIGMRNFQNYGLLDAVGRQGKPVLLKRGSWGTIDEILGVCERVMHGGNRDLVVCLRGVVGMPSYRHVFPSVRWAPDLMMIPALKRLTRIPVFFDPSHSTGYAPFVPAMSLAATAAGADGLMIESHPRPSRSISDAVQTVDLATTRAVIRSCRELRRLLGRANDTSSRNAA
ncbi:MAG: 3-deoxy-7-phosphoheptulonate synthase [Elusimicrobia bacterium]|nr:3-deoxy-7-phosphoheptulonate synthase [Elusimicrobiota bacterium]